MPPASPLPIIDGKYQLLRQLGQGGMGAVYEARHLGTARRVAVKVIASESLSKSADVVSRFRREAMASGAIESQYIAHVTDTGVDPSSGSPYMVMDLLDGEDVEHAIRRVGPLAPDVALRVIAQACLGLQRAHEAAVVHRDIKPANLFLARRDRDGGELVVKILDFGIAKMKTEQAAPGGGNALTRTGSMLGSPLYMSPEQALGRKTIDHRTDIWSLGVVLYEALTGAAPHASAETVGELIVNICHQPPRHVQELAPWVPAEVAAIVHRALALDPAARFASAKEMFAATRERLAQGHTLDESMVVALPPETRKALQPRLALGADVRVPPQSSPDAVSHAATGPSPSGAVRASTTAGVESSALSPAGRPARSRIAVPLGIAALAVAVIGAGTYMATSRREAKGAAGPVAPPETVVTVAPPLASSAPPVVASPPPSAASSAAALVPVASPPPLAVTASAPAAIKPPPPAQPHPHPVSPAPTGAPAPTKPATPKPPVPNDIF